MGANEVDYVKIGQRIKEIRNKKGFASCSYLAGSCGCP